MSRSLLIYYLLVIYVFASFLWWTYLLLDSNSEIMQARRELMELKKSSELAYRKSKIDFYKSKTYEELRAKYQRRIRMIIGEGSVFVVLLAFGIWKTKQSIQKEVALARQQKNFMLSITHELKSPLSAIKLSLETLGKRELEKEKVNRLTNNALNDVERLQNLVDNILLAAKIENHTYNYLPENFNLSSFILEILNKTKEHCPVENRTFEFNMESGVHINGDRLAISSVVSNLIENAVKYSDKDSTIRLSLKATKEAVVFEVVDTGMGVKDDDKEKIFEKFYRAGNEETRKTSGTGLGLYIVKEIVHAHHGKVTVSDNHPKGAVFRVHFPLEKDFKG